MTRIKQLVVALSISFTAEALLAYEPSAPPYPKGKFPENCAINQLAAKEETPRTEPGYKSKYTITRDNKIYDLAISMDYAEDTFGLYASLASDKEKLIQKVLIGDYPTYIDHVYSGFLNKDDRLDFIVNMQAGDKNLTGNRQHSYFMLSKGDRYVVRKLVSYSLQKQDFYDYSQDDKCEYLHVSFVSDQKQHYWVYNVLQFIDDDIVSKNQLSRYFPKWITFGDANKPVMISKKEKLRLWKGFGANGLLIKDPTENK